jgi:hypothetical protein
LSNMTTPPLTRNLLTIPDFQKHYSDFPPLAWPSPLRLFPIPQDEITAEVVSFLHSWDDPWRIAWGYRHTYIWELPGMHEIMENTLGLLYTYPRGLLWRRRWKLEVMVKYFLLSNSPMFWVAPRIIKKQICHHHHHHQTRNAFLCALCSFYCPKCEPCWGSGF